LSRYDSGSLGATIYLSLYGSGSLCPDIVMALGV